jgi:hypothetical protein
MPSKLSVTHSSVLGLIEMCQCVPSSLLKGPCSASLIKLAPFSTPFLICSLCYCVPKYPWLMGNQNSIWTPRSMIRKWHGSAMGTWKVPSTSFIMIKGRPSHWCRNLINKKLQRCVKNSCEDNDGELINQERESLLIVRVKEIIPTEASLMRVVVVVFCDGHLSIFTDSMSKLTGGLMGLDY